MSTMRIIVLLGICLLLEGCVPVASTKSVVVLIISLVAALFASLGVVRDNDAERVYQKAQDLDDDVTRHEQQYHVSGTIVEFEPVIKPTIRTNGAVHGHTVQNFSQRM